jgi:hypothetical protein
MTMYLPNPDLQPSGSEVAEFIDVFADADTHAEVDGSIERRTGTTVLLDTQTRLNITRWAEEYITGLVENHNGGPDEVRSIIHELYDERALTYQVGKAGNASSPLSPRPDG